MHETIGFTSYVLSSLGLTVLVVWPIDGPTAWLRDRVLRKLLVGGMEKVLDCYVCLSFWSGLALSPIYWSAYREIWCWSGPLIGPFVFWLLLREPT